MCQAGGPRCPDTEGKRIQARLSKKVQRRAAADNKTVDQWKTDNIHEYNEMSEDAYIEIDPPWEDDNGIVTNSWVQEYLMQVYGHTEIEDREEMPSNREHLPDDAQIISPTPNPVFVYGTLRSGESNYSWALDGKTQRESRSVRLPGTRMYSNGGFPYTLDDNSHAQGVKGDLMYAQHEHYNDVMDSLDSLEGARVLNDEANHYNRHLMYVDTGDNKFVQAWVYIPPKTSQEHIKLTTQEVESGDWHLAPRVRFRRHRHTEPAG